MSHWLSSMVEAVIHSCLRELFSYYNCNETQLWHPAFYDFSIGRKKTLYVSFILTLASSVALAWAQNFLMYVILRFIIGAANAGIFMTGFVIGQ